MKRHITFLLVVLILSFVGYIYLNNNPFGESNNQTNRTVFAESDVSFQYALDSKTSFYYSNRHFYSCTKDGIKYYNSRGEERWNHPFTMNAPVLQGAGDLVGVTEERGLGAFVFNSSGVIFSKQFDGPVLGFTISKSGLFAIIIQKENTYEIQVYNQANTKVPIWSGFYEDENVFPISVDISIDGRILVVSLLDVNELVPKSKLIFYYLGNEGRAHNDTMFASKEPGYVVYQLKFMENNNLLSLSTDELVCYSVSNSEPSVKWSYELKNKIDRVTYIESKAIALGIGESLVNKTGEEPGVLVYGLNGERMAYFKSKRPITYLSAGRDGFIAGTGRSYYAFNQRGGSLWSYVATSDIRQILFTDSSSNILIVTSGKAFVAKKAKQSKEDLSTLNADDEAAAWEEEQESSKVNEMKSVGEDIESRGENAEGSEAATDALEDNEDSVENGADGNNASTGTSEN